MLISFHFRLCHWFGALTRLVGWQEGRLLCKWLHMSEFWLLPACWYWFTQVETPLYNYCYCCCCYCCRVGDILYHVSQKMFVGFSSITSKHPELFLWLGGSEMIMDDATTDWWPSNSWTDLHNFWHTIFWYTPSFWVHAWLSHLTLVCVATLPKNTPTTE